MWQGPAILVTTEAVRQRLLMVEIPRLRQWVPFPKSIRTGDRWFEGFDGLLLTTPQAWLSDRLTDAGGFPAGIPTLIDEADDLERWTREQLTVTLQPKDWNDLMLACPEHSEEIRDIRVQLTRSIFQHPITPYNRYLIEPAEQECLVQLYEILRSPIEDCSARWPQAWQNFATVFHEADQLLWTEVSRDYGQFSLLCGPTDVAAALAPVWSKQPVVLVGGALDLDAEAQIYRQRLGLAEEMTCLKFSPDRQTELIQLYLPDGLPMPNTPQFQPAILQEVRAILGATYTANQGLTVLLVGDDPLKAQIGSILAAEFGSRVQVEKTCLDDRGILVTGWEFWQQHQAVIPAPQLLMMTTLPLPSLEDPLVAGRVAYYKQQRQDWFRLYLLPEALNLLQRAIAPVRESQGVVAILDNRVNHRSYGQQILTALSPLARINYVDASLFNPLEGLESAEF
jgi:ATP-dependent DNA helicase DinG